MCNMCHFCGAVLTKSKQWNTKQEFDDSLELNCGGRILYCKLCKDKQEQVSMKWDPLSPYATPLISPSVSLSSCDSFVSSCSEFSVDVNSYGRSNQEEVTTDSSQEDLNFRLNGHSRKSSLATPMGEIDSSGTVMENNLKERIKGNDAYLAKDVEIIREKTGDNSPERVDESCIEVSNGTDLSGSIDEEFDSQFWEPPEAEDSEDDMEGSVANFDDDDDECGDGTKWGKPSSLSRFGEGSGSYSFKEEKKKAMEEVMNGKFKVIVGQLLKSVGIVLLGEDGESWLDVVTSLSWEAASFVKPEAIEGKAMDPEGYVKVKCIASGSRSQSQVIKGLVFKKHAAHKHMPTKYKNPRLLLIRGMLGQSSSGLSSFKSMEQENDNLKSFIEMIEMTHPNVVLVEKTVSRDVQERILAKGITLVFDMKLHRLERVARCTGSPILSPNTLMGQKLKQCDYFRFEKFIEEHACSGEGGKRPSKTLMFIEGCPTRLGCTILLKGTHSDELKKTKYVVLCAVIIAYHLILETSFLVDQRTMFSTIPFVGMGNVWPTDQQSLFTGSTNSSLSCPESTAQPTSTSTIDIPISNEGPDNLNLQADGNSALFSEPYNPAFLSGLSSFSASLRKVMQDGFPLSSISYPSLSSYLGFSGSEHDSQITATVPVLSSPGTFDHCDVEAKGSSDEEKLLHGERPLLSISTSGEVPVDTQTFGGCNEEQTQNKDGMGSVLDSQSILVLMSSRNISRGNICEQSHFSHIKFYRNFDVPLGKFLRENLLNQRHQCTTCGEPPEAHFYYYAHHNKQLTIQVKQLPNRRPLPGEAEGKLWMWSRCGKCKARNGISKSTKRVLISTAACGLSFGKFLEISFSQGSSLVRIPSCGHSLDRDFLCFFGFGLMVAMFRYSSVATYNVSVPPRKLDFCNSIRKEWLTNEIENVHKKGILLFSELEGSLQKIGSQFAGSSLNFQGSSKKFSDIEEMLRDERSHFQVSIKNVKNGNPAHPVYKLLILNRLLWELLLESCVWDRRLHLLLSYNSTMSEPSTANKGMQEQFNLKKDDTATQGINEAGHSGEVFDDCDDVKVKLETSLKENEFPTREIPVLGSNEQNDPFNTSIEEVDIESPVESLGQDDLVDHGFFVGHNVSAHLHSSAGNSREENGSSDHLEADKTIPVNTDHGNNAPILTPNVSLKGSTCLLSSNFENSKEYVWTPFLEIQQDCIKDLLRGYLPKFEPIGKNNSAECFHALHQLMNEEGSRLYINLSGDDYMVLDFDGELSSIIACALALLKDSPIVTEELDEVTRKDNAMVSKMTENSPGMTRIASISLPHLSSTGSLDSVGIHSIPSVSSDESRFSSFDGFNLLNSLASLSALHPEISLGTGKLPGKSKYSVVCLYANQFRDLRNQCCPSELDYIASLSRCRNWDAKGGKSKSFFAKTLDDRFIIKEIKKTEFDSFLKFAPDYFGYMNESFKSGNQTCLAKILGIYQVKQMKNGKEVKHDLMVMENLTFGRNITRQYDLKGALHARYNLAADGSGEVLLDQNFVNDMNASPLYVSNKAKRILHRGVWNDTTFLNSIHVMDYSLLVGVDSDRRELVCGIIDYLRQYTWDKQLETWVKSTVVPRNLMPTVISPIEYKKRFRKFMSTHFLSVPDSWCSQRSSDPCELCGIGDDDSSRSRPNFR